MTAPVNPFRIAVLASGRGSNLAALIEACADGRIPARIVLAASDKVTAPALRLAEARSIATLGLAPRGYPSRAAFDADLFVRVAASGADLVVLAGFMRILDAEVADAWAGRIVNIHPSLLPKYPGLDTHRRALEAGDAAHGASVHFVTAELDGGPLIAQVRIATMPDDTAESLAARLLPCEHELLVACVAEIASGRIRLDGQRVLRDGEPLARPLELAAGKLVASAA